MPGDAVLASRGRAGRAGRTCLYGRAMLGGEVAAISRRKQDNRMGSRIILTVGQGGRGFNR